MLLSRKNVKFLIYKNKVSIFKCPCLEHLVSTNLFVQLFIVRHVGITNVRKHLFVMLIESSAILSAEENVVATERRLKKALICEHKKRDHSSNFSLGDCIESNYYIN